MDYARILCHWGFVSGIVLRRLVSISEATTSGLSKPSQVEQGLPRRPVLWVRDKPRSGTSAFYVVT